MRNRIRFAATLCAMCALGGTVSAAETIYTDYAAFRAKIARGGEGVLVIGNADVGGVAANKPTCHVPPGYAGFADGVYRCWFQGGQPVMQPVGRAVNNNCPDGRCPLQTYYPTCPGGNCRVR
jgi:hypothetical protein